MKERVNKKQKATKHPAISPTSPAPTPSTEPLIWSERHECWWPRERRRSGGCLWRKCWWWPGPGRCQSHPQNQSLWSGPTRSTCRASIPFRPFQLASFSSLHVDLMSSSSCLHAIFLPLISYLKSPIIFSFSHASEKLTSTHRQDRKFSSSPHSRCTPDRSW